MRKADVLRDYSGRGKLGSENIYLILNGEIGQPPKKNRTPTVKVSKDVYAKYFTPKQTTKEIQEYVEKALDYYSTHLTQTHHRESTSQPETANNAEPIDDEECHEPDDDIEI